MQTEIKKITKEALVQIKNQAEENHSTTVVYDPKWHKGVIGIVASRLIEHYYRPTLVFTKSGDQLAASARSVSGFDVYDALEECSTHISQFGGHKYAAGLTLKPENYQNFKQAFERVVKNTITEDALYPEIQINQEIRFEEISENFYRILKQFGPFGPQNRKPIFLLKNVIDAGFTKTIGKDNSHLKLTIKNSQSRRQLNGIGFGFGHLHPKISSGVPFDVAFSIEENEWNGQVNLQINVKDIRFANAEI